jgi:hypothetical protein
MEKNKNFLNVNQLWLTSVCTAKENSIHNTIPASLPKISIGLNALPENTTISQIRNLQECAFKFAYSNRPDKSHEENFAEQLLNGEKRDG